MIIAMVIVKKIVVVIVSVDCCCHVAVCWVGAASAKEEGSFDFGHFASTSTQDDDHVEADGQDGGEREEPRGEYEYGLDERGLEADASRVVVDAERERDECPEKQAAEPDEHADERRRARE